MDKPPRKERRGRPLTLPRDEQGRPIKPLKKKQGTIRKEDYGDLIVFRYTQYLMDGLSHEEAIEKLTNTPLEYETGGTVKEVSASGEVKEYIEVVNYFLSKDAVKKYISESRKHVVTGDEYRSSKALQQNPKWKEIFYKFDK